MLVYVIYKTSQTLRDEWVNRTVSEIISQCGLFFMITPIFVVNVEGDVS